MTTSGKGRIFISYRRTDSAGYAGRIYDRLTAHFGEDAVFMDVDTIEAGVDFVHVLQNAVQSCDVLVALIGQRWLTIKSADGKRRLDDPEDFVRIEVAAALDRDIRVIPVLVDGTTMPHSTELPHNLKLLARRNALKVDHDSFNAGTQRLISQIELALRVAERMRVEKARREQEAQEKKEAEEKRAREAAAKVTREREERERKEREERAQKEKARRAALRKQRQQEFSERIKNIFLDGRKLPFFIGGGVIILFFLGYIIKSSVISFATALPTETSITSPLLPATSTEIPSTPTTVLVATSTIESTSIPTLAPPANPSRGSTWLQTKDGMVMVYVPAGDFQMGSEDGNDDERPVHTVYLDAYWIDQTEVTNQMYAVFLDSEGLQSEGGQAGLVLALICTFTLWIINGRLI